MKWINHRKAIHIHDDVMGYLRDSLNWVNCYNPAMKMKKHKGLNYYGPTVIKKDGAERAEEIFTAWADLFSACPKTIRLTGAYEWTVRQSKEEGSYAIIRVDRDELVPKLRTIAEYSKSVRSSNDELFLLHLGI